MSITYQPYGENAILISWPNEISESNRQEIYIFNQKIQSLVPKYIIETVTAYCSLTIYLQSDCNQKALLTKLKSLQLKQKYIVNQSKLWEIPVCYDLSLGLDLKELAQQKKLSVEKVIQLHSQTIYTVDFLGFLPGFPYLSGLNPMLHTPRLKTPRQSITKGSIGIGGNQTGIYPIDSPGGWNIIGQTPLSFFDPNKPQPCFIRPLDTIKFQVINFDEFNDD